MVVIILVIINNSPRLDYIILSLTSLS